MLPERHVQLLTAYVDGELSASQRRRAARLLRRSDEARALLRRLQDDARQLRELPRVAAPIDFSGPVLSAIGQSRPRSAPAARPVRAEASFPAWGGWAAAAAVLLLVGVGSFLLSYSGGPAPVNRDHLAHHGPTPKDSGKQRREPRDGSLARADRGRGKAKQNDPPPARHTEEKLPPPDREPVGPPERPIGPDRPSDPKPEGPVLTSPQKEAGIFLERVELALPVVHPLYELDRPENARKLHDQLAAAPAWRIELPARDAFRGLERVRAAVAGQKRALLIDPSVQARLKKPQFRHDLALFVENISPADLAALLGAIGKADRLAADRKPAEQRFDGSLVVKELSRLDQKELAELLGVDPVQVRPAPPKPRAGVDIRRPLSEQTGAEVVEALEGKGRPRPGATTAPPVVVLPLSRSPARSAELRRFLETRQPSRPGTLQVFLVLRNLPH